jgi:type I restriction enzyme S subunit
MTRTAASLATGPFGQHWASVAVKHLAVFQSGSAIDGEKIEDFGTYPVYGGNGLRGYTERFTHKGEFVLVGRQGALCGNINYAEGRFWASEHALVGHPRRMFDRQWFGEVLRTANLGQFSTAAAQPGIAAEVVNNLRIPVPSVETQRLIARFLDRETGLIDGLIEKKTRFIALLKEKRAAVITHAVTKGIDSDAPMKDSGVDWLGRVPAHWEVIPPTALFTESKERAREGDQMLSATQKYGVIPLAEYEALEQRQVTMAVVNLDMRKHVEVGDFVISMRSMDGGLERARAVGSVRSSYSVLKPGPDVEGRFYGALMKSSLYIQALRLTSNFIRDGQDLNFGHVRKVKLPKPDLREQAAIADHIEAETARIDGLITLTERSIDLLREKRAALITAAVTGKIDVRVAA